MGVVVFDLKKIDENDKWDEFQETMDDWQDAYVKETQQLAKKLGVSDECARCV